VGLLVIAFAILAPSFSFGFVVLSVEREGDLKAEKLLLRFSAIEAHAIRLRGGDWVALANTSANFDLLSQRESQRIAFGLVSTGQYDALRLAVANATMVKDGKVLPLSSQRVIVAPGNFSVKFGKTTALTIVIKADPFKLETQNRFEASASLKPQPP